MLCKQITRQAVKDVFGSRHCAYGRKNKTSAYTFAKLCRIIGNYTRIENTEILFE